MDLATVAGWVFVGIALAVGAFTILNRIREEEPRRWPRVTGRIVAAGAVRGRVRIHYRYEVDEVVHHSERVSLSLLPPSPRVRRRRLRHYHAGDSVRVFYDPRHPERSVLERRVMQGASAVLIVAALFLAYGLSLLAGHSR